MIYENVHGDIPTLFGSEAWLNAWMLAWGDNAELEKITMGYRPFFRTKQQLRFGIELDTLIPAGVSAKSIQSIRAEYFLPGEWLSWDQYLLSIINCEWDQLWLPDVLKNSSVHEAILTSAEKFNLKIIEKGCSATYGVDLKSMTFDQYLKQCGSNTRLKLFNHRKKLGKLGAISVSNIWPDIDQFLFYLNQFHMKRWTRPCYDGRNLTQIKLFLNALFFAGGKVDLSVLSLNDEPVSVVLDVSYEGRIYNIQSGFIEKIGGGISLGTLHFGYQLERAFENYRFNISMPSYYDFMAGTGKNSDYKKSISNSKGYFVDFMLVRSSFFKALYWVHSKLNKIKEFP